MADNIRCVYSVEELEALPVGSVVMWDDGGGDLEVAITRDAWVDHTGNDYWSSDFERVGFPATVLYVPGEGDRG